MPDAPVVLSAHFLTAAEAQLVKRAAKAVGMTVSSFLRKVALKRADEIASSWDVRQMKARIDGAKKPPKLRVIEGGKE